jgi:hypothetical protein
MNAINGKKKPSANGNYIRSGIYLISGRKCSWLSGNAFFTCHSDRMGG